MKYADACIQFELNVCLQCHVMYVTKILKFIFLPPGRDGDLTSWPSDLVHTTEPRPFRVTSRHGVWLVQPGAGAEAGAQEDADR